MIAAAELRSRATVPGGSTPTGAIGGDDAGDRERPLAHLGLLLSVGLVLLGFDIGARVFVTNDEARFPLLARDILAHGHWLLPRLEGAPYLNKPPLFAWLIAVSAWPHGAVTQFNAALPSLIAGLGTIAGTCWMARRLFGSSAGLMAGLIVVGTLGVFHNARQAMPDMALVAIMTAALALYVEAEFFGRRAALVGCYALSGLAFLIKGAAGLLPLLVVLAHGLATGGTRRALRLVPPIGFLILVTLVVPWALFALYAGGGQFVQGTVADDNLAWYFSLRGRALESLARPFANAFTVLIPWALLLPFGIRSAFHHGGSERGRRTRFLLLSLTILFLALALSREQRLRYYLPLCPPAAVLVAAWVSDVGWRRRGLAFAIAWVALALGLVAGERAWTSRRNMGTDVHAIAQELLARSAPVYAVDAPQMVLEFYQGIPFRPLPSSAAFLEQAQEVPRYLITGEGQLQFLESAGVRTLARSRVGGRPVILLIRE